MTRSSVTLPGDVTVEVVQGDVTQFHTDAIVCSNNVELGILAVRSLSRVIVTAGICRPVTGFHITLHALRV